MEKYFVNADRQHFDWIREIAFDIERLSSFFQNPNVVITEEEWEEFNHRYLEVCNQLSAWHSESLSRFKKINLEDD